MTNLGSNFAVERIEIAHEGIEVDNDLAEVSYGIAKLGMMLSMLQVFGENEIHLWEI